MKYPYETAFRLVALLACLLPGIAHGQSFFTPLAPITDGLQWPEDVAVAADNTIYVADSKTNQAIILSPNGNRSAVLIESPTCIAAGFNGRFYVGSGKDLSVKIFNSDGQLVGHLGAEHNEFKLPRNITVDPYNGQVYVVDQLEHKIKMYSPTGESVGQIDDSPNLPQDIAIVGSELFILDQPLELDPEGNTIRGARIAIFDLNGNFRDEFGSSGTGNDEFLRPQAIVSDDNGTLYVSDFFHGVVRSFDIYGVLLNTFQDPNCSMLTPKGIAITPDGHMLIASPFSKSLRVIPLLRSAGMLAPMTVGSLPETVATVPSLKIAGASNTKYPQQYNSIEHYKGLAKPSR